MSSTLRANGDLNITSMMRETKIRGPDLAYSTKSLAITENNDDAEVRAKYRPYLLDPNIVSNDWVSKLELSTVIQMAEADLKATGERLRVLVLYGSLRNRLVLPE